MQVTGLYEISSTSSPNRRGLELAVRYQREARNNTQGIQRAARVEVEVAIIKVVKHTRLIIDLVDAIGVTTTGTREGYVHPERRCRPPGDITSICRTHVHAHAHAHTYNTQDTAGRVHPSIHLHDILFFSGGKKTLKFLFCSSFFVFSFLVLIPQAVRIGTVSSIDRGWGFRIYALGGGPAGGWKSSPPRVP